MNRVEARGREGRTRTRDIVSMRGVVLLMLALVAGALLVSETTMQPTGRQRVQLALTFAAVAMLTAAAAALLSRVSQRLRSIRHAVLMTAIGAMAAAALAIGAAAGTMFLSTQDLRLVLIAIALGVGLGVVLADAVTQPLQDALERIGATASAVADGDLDARTGVDRPDEVGELAQGLDRMVDQLQHAAADRDRMQAARDHFLAALGHDLRTPLASLRGAIEALQDGVAPDPARYLAAMGNDVRLLSGMVEDLFLMARIESDGLDLRQELLDLREVADESIESVRPIADARGVRLHLDTDGAATVHGADRELGRVMRNLLDNAIRHCPTGGNVTLRLRNGDGRVRIEVLDDGPGFDADFVSTAFESFTRADAARSRADGGAGLGLAIARGLVEAHAGEIRAEPGPGGKVLFGLPAA